MRKEAFTVEFYDFQKSPDGHDCLEKTYYFTKYAGIFGAVFSFYEAALFSKPTTVYGTLARFGRFTLPFAGMGFVFGSSVCVLAHLRKKNDVPNHVIAGALAGSIWGFKYNSVRIGHTWGLFFAILAGYIKFFEVNKIPMLNRAPEWITQNRPNLHWGIKLYDDPGRPDEA
ncbi:NADH dehydrogenase [ubiquinone] 1 alpha subcomplex subunit 11 [Parasteatoda tepidariorum]|uniref:NADH dehydrogenase [ubiquinone] 1 alpha subcomplex subunit 11 n=1 Tax=Parasteatoda tepidariorum TaxID=114398 RepID=UPI00077F8AD8|nr:NADH dehydrogenase [ubiquinone] 1 alpha subcomplex subunit 11 [Parasteatoda tepidariorum]